MDSELIVRLSRLTNGPLLERRNEINRDFVKAGLSQYNVNDSFSLKSLSDGIKKLASVHIEEEVVIAILEDLSQNGFVNHISDLDYIINKKIEIPQFEDLTYDVWKEFEKFLKMRHADYDPYIDSVVKDVFNSVLLKLSVNIVQSQKTQIDSLPIENFRAIIEEEVHGENINWENKFVDIFCEYILSKSPSLLKFIFERYSGIINMDLILRAREMPCLNLIDNIGFLLVDTTFLVALMCKTDPTYSLALAVSVQSKKRSVPLFYTEETKREMWSLINGSKSEMQGLLVGGDPNVIRSQFVRDFNRLKNKGWPEYYADLCSWEDVIKLFWNIQQFPYDCSIDEITYNYVKVTLPLLDQLKRSQDSSGSHILRKPPRNEQQIEHDAKCLGIIASARKVLEGKISLGPWFLTFDNLVFTVSELAIKKNFHKFGYAIQPRTWLNYLLAFSQMDFNEEDKNAVAEAVIIFTARTQNTKITIEEYSRLTTYKLGLEDQDIKLIKEIFLRSPLRAELERALEFEHGGEADRIAHEIISQGNLKEFIDEVVGVRDLKKDYARVIERLSEVDQLYHEERAARQALENSEKPYLINSFKYY